MTSEDIAFRLRWVANQLREIAAEYSDMKFTAAEEAMLWPLAVVVEDDGGVGMWCAEETCLLDGHNSKIDINLEHFTAADLISYLVGHIAHNAERAGIDD